MKKILILAVFLPFLLVSCNPAPEEETGEPLAAEIVLKNAMKLAKKEKKNVIIMWHASWCGWCHRMDTLMQREDLKDYFDSNFITEHLVVKERPDLKHLENPGADSLLAIYHGDKAGIPFWIVLDKKGNLLADSFMRKEGVSMDEPGQNVGCPGQPEEVDFLVDLLKKTAKIDEEGLAKIREAFLLKK